LHHKKLLLWIILLGIFITLPLIFVYIVPNYLPTPAPADVDRITTGPYAGNYLVTNGLGSIVILDYVHNKVLWETDEPVFFVHDADMMPDGKSIIVADTGADHVFVMNLSNKAILWEWYAKNTTHNTYMDYINWTEFGITHGWSSEAIKHVETFNPPLPNLISPDRYYSHLNTVQFLNGTIYGRPYDSVLISLRNFDMVIEVNYTAQLGEPGYMNITWWYGEPRNFSILNHQHAPKRWTDGHLTICDSEKSRVIEIDENNQLVWEYTDKKLRWARDCERLPNGNYLITDSCNNRLFEVNITSNTIVKTFTDLFLGIPYEADYSPEDNQVIAGCNQIIIVFDYTTGQVVARIGFPWFIAPILIILGIIFSYVMIDCIYQYHLMKGYSPWKRLKSQKIYGKIVILLSLSLLFSILNYVVAFLWYYILF